MYKPPENCNRVKLIKSKFENIESTNNIKNGLWNDSNGSATKHIVVNPLSKNLSRQLSDPARKNIKRTPAFRFDINSEKTSVFERNQHNRSFYLEKLQYFNNGLKNNCDNKKILSDSENAHSPLNVKNEKKDCLTSAKFVSSLNVASVSPPCDKNVKITQNDTQESSIKNSPGDGITQLKENTCLYTEPIKKSLVNKNQKSSESQNSENGSVDVSTIVFTDTLKAALKRPLPKGPAPQKPPRTFEHTPVTETNENSKNISFDCNKQKPVKKNVPQECKHDARYMLNKLENALRENKIKSLKRALKSEVSINNTSDLCQDKKSYHSPNETNQPFNTHNSLKLNCFNGLTCQANYEAPKAPTSSFFVDCKPEPIYAEPFISSQEATTTEALKNLKNQRQIVGSLYYMSTPLLPNDDTVCRTMNEDMQNNEKSGDDCPQFSLTTGSDSDSASWAAVTDKKISDTSVKRLIDTFETKQPVNLQKSDNQCDLLCDRSHRIEEIKMSLQKTIEKCFENETKDSSDEVHSTEHRVSVDKIIDKFQTYVKTMPKYQQPKLLKDDRLFWCCLIVGWDQDIPKIKFKHPASVKIPNRMEYLCFPEATSGPLDVSNNAQCYSLVITDDKGERTFGYCRRVIPEGSTKCIPLTYCILSKHRAPRFYKRVLTELESRHGIPDKLRDELINEFYQNKFPRPGESVKIDLSKFVTDVYVCKSEKHKTDTCNSELTDSCNLADYVKVDISRGNESVNDKTSHYENIIITENHDISTFPDIVDNKTTELVLTLHHDTRYEEADLRPLHKLPSTLLLKIFASLLLERKVILISCVISKLSSCVDALQSILYPFSWPHAFIPILPQCLWDVVESPTPVICGILSVSVVNEHKIEHGIVVDLDEGNIVSEEGDEDNILSGSMKKAWNQGLALANTIPPNDYAHSVFLSDAYIKVFIVALKHYKNYIVNNGFEKDNFIKNAKTKGIKRFLKWFTETTMFNTFMDSVLSNAESYSLFDKKIEMYGSEESNIILTKLREWNRT